MRSPNLATSIRDWPRAGSCPHLPHIGQRSLLGTEKGEQKHDSTFDRKKATAERRPRPGFHHLDRAIQYAGGEYVAMLEQYGMVPRMSRPANPYDNASCESFMKTLKREENLRQQIR